MAEGILGLGTGQAASLNQELIDKLKTAEKTAKITPIETDLEEWETENEKITEIISLANAFLETVKPFDLFITSGTNAFDDKSATTSGDSVVFDAVDVASLNTGTTSVTVTTLAQRDVYQTVTFADKDVAITGTDSSDKITINGTEFLTDGKTYQEVADAINADVDFNATVELVGTSSYRLIIKSAESGTDNALSITETGIDLGLSQFTSTSTVTAGNTPAIGLSLTMDGTTFTTTGSEDYTTFVGRINSDVNFDASIVDGNVLIRKADGSALNVTTDDLSLGMVNNNNTLSAQNLVATVDGVDYDVSSNVITVDGGLKITAVKAGDSSISVEKDTSTLTTKMEDFITNYNTLVTAVDAELYASETTIQDKATLRTIMNTIKDNLFSDYGDNDDLNIFNYGFSLDKSGYLSLNSSTFASAVEDDFDNLKSLFIGTAANEGLGTQLKTFVDSLDGFDGLLTGYETNMTSRKESLTEELAKAEEDLDDKYAQLSLQFAAYGAIITRFESQFSGLKLLIEQSTAS